MVINGVVPEIVGAGEIGLNPSKISRAQIELNPETGEKVSEIRQEESFNPVTKETVVKSASKTEYTPEGEITTIYDKSLLPIPKLSKTNWLLLGGAALGAYLLLKG